MNAASDLLLQARGIIAVYVYRTLPFGFSPHRDFNGGGSR